MHSDVPIIACDRSYQDSAATLINEGLGEHFGFIDETMNPDLLDIESSYSDGEFLLAVEGDQLAGTGALLPESSDVGRIVRMHTASTHRRRGIATQVLIRLEQLARERSFSSLILDTNLDWVDAIAFYIRNGYEELGRNDLGIRFQKLLNPE